MSPLQQFFLKKNEKFLFSVDSSRSVVNFFSHYFDGEKKVSPLQHFFFLKKMKSSYFRLIRPDRLSIFLVIILTMEEKKVSPLQHFFFEKNEKFLFSIDSSRSVVKFFSYYFEFVDKF